MRVISKSILPALLLVAALLSRSAVAAPIYLPESHYEDGAWWGTAYYTDYGFNVRIDFAVYDTWTYPGDFTWASEVEMPITDQFIYAYQIFNHPEATLDIGFFQILNEDLSEVAQYLMNGTSAQDDATGGIEPDPTVSEVQAIWEWTSDGGYVIPGTHSWLLIFSSEYGPTKGWCEIKLPEDDDIPIPEVPEPSTIALFGIGIALTFAKRRKLA